MTTTTLSAAVIGAGMAGTTHANAWRQVGTVFDLDLPTVRLATIADAHLPFAQDAARRYGYEKATDDWRDIVDDPSIDIVSIVVGNALHLEMADALARAGKHVLCEKPLTDTLESAQEMAALESQVEVVTAIGYTYRRNPAVAQLARLAKSGHLGDINHFDGRYWCDYAVDPNVPMAWRYKGPMGSGALGDIGSHLVDAAEFICGPITSVSGAVLTTSITHRPVVDAVIAGGRGTTAAPNAAGRTEPVENDDVATFTAHFASRAAGTFSVSRVAYGMPNDLVINVMGGKGRAMWDLARCGEILLDDGAGAGDGLGGARQILVNPRFPYFARGSSMAFGGVGLTQIEQFTYQAYAFLQQVMGVSDGFPPCATFADGYREMRILDAVARSAAAGGAAVTIDR